MTDKQIGLGKLCRGSIDFVFLRIISLIIFYNSIFIRQDGRAVKALASGASREICVGSSPTLVTISFCCFVSLVLWHLIFFMLIWMCAGQRGRHAKVGQSQSQR
ncbi:hypothetical protein BKA63DRAFT_155208 [Paraphoma chrysanthemicola]|nr:hypothetical protein BKA63DRAFT_155208 [Paraphoma chrysanthemicola]